MIAWRTRLDQLFPSSFFDAITTSHDDGVVSMVNLSRRVQSQGSCSHHLTIYSLITAVVNILETFELFLSEVFRHLQG